jgi:6-phosphogluconolactonase
VYVSNRGHDSVAIVLFDTVSGALRVSSWKQDLISWPRGMNLSPEGDVLVVANQQGVHGNTVVAFTVSASGSTLTVAGEPQVVDSPTDIFFPL